MKKNDELKNVQSEEKNSPLGTKPIGSLMLKLCLPAITAQVVNALYSIVDRIYIGHISTAASLALTGIGVCNPIIMIVSAFSLFAGAGGAPLAAIELGKSEHDKNATARAENILGNAFLMLTVFSVLIPLFFLTFQRPILFLFGASEATIPYAQQYLSIYLLGTLFVQFAVGLNPFISCQGRAGTAMISIIIGAVCNIVLDPVFIFVFGMGVRGAAIATVISQALSAVWILAFLSSKKSAIRLNFKSLKFAPKVTLKISSLGISPFIMSATESAVFVVFNSGLQRFGGDIYVGAMTILQSLMNLFYIPIQGFTDGVQSIISYNYGAKKIDRVKKTIRRMTVISVSASVASSLIINIFPMPLVSIFTSHEELAVLSSRLLVIYCGAVWIFGLQMAAQRTFVATGKAGTSIFVALLRKVILLIPLALIFPHFIGVEGIFIAEPVSSTVSALTAGILLLKFYKKLNKEKQL